MLIRCADMIRLLGCGVFLLSPGAVAADEGKTPGAPSESYQKDEKFLPGEEVITPSGQKLKVWSTEGGVDVSKAPEPFQDERARTGAVNVVIDGRSRASRTPQPAGDSFDVGAPR